MHADRGVRVTCTRTATVSCRREQPRVSCGRQRLRSQWRSQAPSERARKRGRRCVPSSSATPESAAAALAIVAIAARNASESPLGLRSEPTTPFSGAARNRKEEARWATRRAQRRAGFRAASWYSGPGPVRCSHSRGPAARPRGYTATTDAISDSDTRSRPVTVTRGHDRSESP